MEKTQGSQATATRQERATGEEPRGVHGVLLSFLHRRSFGSSLKTARSLSAARGGKEQTSTGYRILQWVSATVVGKSRPQPPPGLEQEGLGVKGKAG